MVLDHLVADQVSVEAGVKAEAGQAAVLEARLLTSVPKTNSKPGVVTTICGHGSASDPHSVASTTWPAQCIHHLNHGAANAFCNTPCRAGCKNSQDLTPASAQV